MVFPYKLKSNIVVTGGNSRFAEILRKKLYGKRIIYTNKNDLNILDIDSIERSLKKYKPKYLIHLASLSRPMEIHEKNIGLSIDTNIVGTANIVKKCNTANNVRKRFNIKDDITPEEQQEIYKLASSL